VERRSKVKKEADKMPRLPSGATEPHHTWAFQN